MASVERGNDASPAQVACHHLFPLLSSSSSSSMSSSMSSSLSAFFRLVPLLSALLPAAVVGGPSLGVSTLPPRPLLQRLRAAAVLHCQPLCSPSRSRAVSAEERRNHPTPSILTWLYIFFLRRKRRSLGGREQIGITIVMVIIIMVTITTTTRTTTMTRRCRTR